jgi:hypothetical protein
MKGQISSKDTNGELIKVNRTKQLETGHLSYNVGDHMVKSYYGRGIFPMMTLQDHRL